MCIKDGVHYIHSLCKTRSWAGGHLKLERTPCWVLLHVMRVGLRYSTSMGHHYGTSLWDITMGHHYGPSMLRSSVIKVELQDSFLLCVFTQLRGDILDSIQRFAFDYLLFIYGSINPLRPGNTLICKFNYTCRSEETFLHYFLIILKQMLQNY